LVGVCLAVIVVSVFGLASDFITHLLGSLDGLLLLMISLMMVLIFGLILLSIAKDEGWLGHKDTAAADSSAAKPAPKPAAAAAKPAAGPGHEAPVGSGEGK